MENEPLMIHCPQCRQKLDASSLPPFTRVNCPVCGSDLIIPKPFDGYMLENVIGEGGMATVYRALDTALNRIVAIKILRDGVGEEVKEKFLTEAKMAAKVAHPAVIAIYTCARCGDCPYIVMEYMDGTTLEKFLQESSAPLDIMQVCNWIGNLAGGLERAQKCGIIHHDIKPANMLLNRDGFVKIGDFGIAGTREEGAEKKPGKVWGSPNYLSPEKALTGKEDHTGDIYSLGASFYHLLTGQVPFPVTGNLKELLSCRIHRDPTAPHLIRSEIPEELSLFVLKMMHRVSGMRPSYQQIRLFLLDFARKNSGKRTRSASGGAAFIPERPPAGTSSSGRISSVGLPTANPKSSATAGSEGRKIEELPKKPVAVQEETPAGGNARWHYLTIFGKLLLFALFFLFVFGISRLIINSHETEKNGKSEQKNIVAEEKK